MKPARLPGLAIAVACALAASPLPASAAPVPQKGEIIFQDRCAFCHANGAGQGPTLKGVVGRPAAAAPGFAYSDALKTSGLTWTPETLSKFLVGPMRMVPGTAMQMTVPDAGERADLIAYLAEQK